MLYVDPTLTARGTNGSSYHATTPGLSIGIATPYLYPTNPASQAQTYLPSTAEEGAALEKRQSHQSQPRTSTEAADYFSENPQTPSYDHAKVPTTPGVSVLEAVSQTPIDVEKEDKTKDIAALFQKKFRFSKKSRSSTEAKPIVIDEKSEESDKSEGREDKVVEDNVYGTIQKIRQEYEEQLQNTPSSIVSTGITPSLPNETPLLPQPPFTTVIVQEDRPDSGGVVDLYRGTVRTLGHDADLIEKVGPMWLGDLLLRVFPHLCLLIALLR